MEDGVRPFAPQRLMVVSAANTHLYQLRPKCAGHKPELWNVSRFNDRDEILEAIATMEKLLAKPSVHLRNFILDQKLTYYQNNQNRAADPSGSS